VEFVPKVCPYISVTSCILSVIGIYTVISVILPLSLQGHGNDTQNCGRYLCTKFKEHVHKSHYFLSFLYYYCHCQSSYYWRKSDNYSPVFEHPLLSSLYAMLLCFTVRIRDVLIVLKAVKHLKVCLIFRDLTPQILQKPNTKMFRVKVYNQRNRRLQTFLFRKDKTFNLDLITLRKEG
jgi:hypothetical protein